VAQELIPWARKNLNIAAGAQHVIVSGSSFGALCSTYCAFIHPEAIGNVVSLSGSYWLNPDWQNNNHPFFSKSGLLIDSFRESKRLPLRFYMEVGRFEGGSSMLGSNRELRDVLLLKGYTLTYKEFDGGHEPIRWRGTLADGLIALSGK